MSEILIPQAASNSGEGELSPEDIRRLVDSGISATFSYLYGTSDYFRRKCAEAGLGPGDVSDAGNLQQLPLTSKQEVSELGQALWTVRAEDIIEISTTSGTTGIPTLYPMTAKDLERLGINEQLSFACAGITPQDTVLVAVTLDRCFIAGLAYYEGLRRIGATAVRVGTGTPGLALSMIERLQPTAIVSVPSYLKRIAMTAAEAGIDLAATTIRKLICIGEPVRDADFSLNPLGRQLADAWGSRVYSTYGITELATSACECDAGAGGHLHPSLMHVEILDDDGRRLPDGVVGEIVATTFGVTAMPLMRFRTGDCSFLRTEQCACGRWTPRIGPILGRKNQLMKVKGTSLYPGAVQRILEGLPIVRDYVMIVSAQSPLSDELEVLVAVHGDEREALQSIANRFQGELKVKPRVTVATIEQIELLQNSNGSRKKQFFIDRRG